jgi:BioD-like phosphotransacetylase family protein
MMNALYLTSIGEAAGKSALCAALGRIFKAHGRKVGYLKPVAVVGQKADASDKDTEFIRLAMALEEPVELLCPVSISAKDLLASANEKEPAWLKKAKEAYTQVSLGKDVVLIEGVGGFKADSAQALAGSRVVETLGAKAILIASYETSLQASQIVDAAKALAGYLLGVVINAVPQRRMESVKATLLKSVEQSGIRVLGALPEDRALLTVSVGELAEHLGSNIINLPERSDNLVEAVMVGAMSPDPAISYLSLKPNKAVVTRGDRPDIQLGALRTSISCLVLTNNINPLTNILSLANAGKVPIVIVKDDTMHTMEALEGIFDKAKFSHEKKVERLEQLLEQHLDLESIYQAAQA